METRHGDVRRAKNIGTRSIGLYDKMGEIADNASLQIQAQLKKGTRLPGKSCVPQYSSSRRVLDRNAASLRRS